MIARPEETSSRAEPQYWLKRRDIVGALVEKRPVNQDRCMAPHPLARPAEGNHQDGISTCVRENAVQQKTALQAVAVTKLEPSADP
jgi:hypothetical protein